MRFGWVRHPVTGLVVLQALVFILPNAGVQLACLQAPWLTLIAFQLLNFSIILGVLFLFKGPRSALLVMLPLAVLALATTDFLKSFGGMPAVGTYLSLGHTNAHEVMGYVKTKGLALAMLAGLSWAYWAIFRGLAAHCQPAAWAKARKPILCLCLGLIAIFVNWDTWFIKYEPGRVEPDATPRKNGFPVGFALSANRAYWYIQGLSKLHNNSFQFKATSAVPVAGREVYVLVIGESASAEFWSLGGYPVDTTPRIRKRQEAGELIYFPRTAAQANVTHLAVPMLITAASPSAFDRSLKEKSILTAFKEAGFTTFWISNQDETNHMTEADFPILLHPRGGFIYTTYDQELVPYLETLLSSSKDKLFVVLHLMGSHIYYQDRVPRSFQTPGLPASALPLGVSAVSPLSDYLRTICYTDFVLDEFIKVLSRVHGRSFLWYVSDHGQMYHPGEVGHGGITPSFFELHVPMFAWGNDTFRAASSLQFQRLKEHSGEVLTQGVTFASVLGLGGVTYPGMDHTRDLSSEAFLSGRKPEVLTVEVKPRKVDDFLANLAAAGH